MPPRHVRPLLALAALAFAACGGGSTEPPAVDTVEVGPAAPTLFIGPGGAQTRQLTGTPRSRSGRALSDPVTWTSLSIGVASVSSTGLVTAVGIGSTTISATAGGKVGSVIVTVQAVPVATVSITPPAAAVYVGVPFSLLAEARDSTGLALPGRSITWASLDTTIATVVATTGAVTTRAAGNVGITATSEGRTATLPLTVLPADGPVLASVAPATLVPGSTATITGTNFDPTPAANTLRVGGTVVPVLGVTATTLTFRTPCLPSGTTSLQVTTARGAGTALDAPLAVTQRALAVGEALVLPTDGTSECNELAVTGGSPRYFLAAFSVATSANTTIDLELVGSATGAGALRMAESRSATPARALPGREQAAGDLAHFRHLENERALYTQLRAEGAFRSVRRTRGARLVAPPAVGSLRSLYYNFGGCADSSQVIVARAVRVGTRAVVWEDTANSLKADQVALLAAMYDRIGEVFDRDQYEAVRTYFGDPLRRDTLTDNDGLLHMVYTARLNSTGAAAYVTSCDMAPRNTTTRAASNFGEFFYGRAPTVATPNLASTQSPDGWFAFMGRTVVHEVKHIASLSARIANGAPTFEQSWLEEGTARHAEEVWVRDSVHRVPWKGNTGWGTAADGDVYCDFNLDDATCTGGDPVRRPTWGVRRQINEILPKLLDPPEWSPFGGANAVFYNTTWSLVRYAIDRYGTTDAGFLTALTQSSSSGMDNLAAVSGASFPQLLGGWGLALLADDYPGLATPSPDVQFPTWNLRSIYLGLHNDPAWSGTYTTPYPVARENVVFGAFGVSRVGVRGGAHLFVELSGTQAAPQLLHLRGAAGAAIPSSARLAIVRVQ